MKLYVYIHNQIHLYVLSMYQCKWNYHTGKPIAKITVHPAQFWAFGRMAWGESKAQKPKVEILFKRK